MKYFLAIMLLMGGEAVADTFTPLQNAAVPVSLQTTGVVRTTCAGGGFSADGSTVAGTCRYVWNLQMRYSHGQGALFAIVWALNGTPTIGAMCGSYPNGVGAPNITYTAGYSAANCNVTLARSTVVNLNGTNYYYVSTSVLGAMLVNTQNGSIVWAP